MGADTAQYELEFIFKTPTPGNESPASVVPHQLVHNMKCKSYTAASASNQSWYLNKYNSSFSNLYFLLRTSAIPGFFAELLLSWKNSLTELEYSITLISLFSVSISSTKAWCQKRPWHRGKAMWSPLRSCRRKDTRSLVLFSVQKGNIDAQMRHVERKSSIFMSYEYKLLGHNLH